eukprot:3030454-Lingulodinium_polyedra.AAC.1
MPAGPQKTPAAPTCGASAHMPVARGLTARYLPRRRAPGPPPTARRATRPCRSRRPVPAGSP